MTEEKKNNTIETGKRVRRAREHKGLTQAQLAEKIHCTQGLVNMIEAGRRGLTKDNVGAVADACGVLTDYLLLRDGFMTAEEKRDAEIGAKYYGNVKREEMLKILSEKSGYSLYDADMLFLGDMLSENKVSCVIVDEKGEKTAFTWNEVCDLAEDIEEYAAMRIRRTIAKKRRLQENG